MRINTSNLEDVFKSTKATVETMELKGYEFIQNLFADSSGLGQPDEASLTPSQLLKELESIVSKHGTVYTFISSQGHFQVNIGVYKRQGNRRTRKVANNTYEVYKTPKCQELEAIRLHDTNIITYLDNGKIRLNNGGWETNTTKERINRYLPEGYTLKQKNWSWLIDTPNGIIEYKNMMEI